MPGGKGAKVAEGRILGADASAGVAPADMRARMMLSVAWEPYQEWRKRRAEKRRAGAVPA